MFKVSRTRFVTGAATVALAAGGIGVGVVSADASTSACTGITQGALAGSCGDLANGSNYGLAVKVSNGQGSNPWSHNQNRAPGYQLTSSKATSTDTGTDFYAHQTNGNASERVLEWAPGGRPRGVCVTQTSAHASLTLDRCNGGASQEFYGIGDTQDDQNNSNHGLQWLNAATGQVIVIGNGHVSTASLASSSHDAGSYLHWVG